jgi:short subunit dehydrogenase-like uncharacterized protein
MLTLFGATGFTGRLAAIYLRDHAPAGLPWAIAGRDRRKLEAVQAELGSAREHVQMIVADVSDPASIDAMVKASSVILTTAGPYAKLGSPVVEACVRHGVDYCDITGETPWVRDMIDAHHEKAAADGTRIVPFCGVDSVPSDIGAAFVVEEIRRQFGAETNEVRAGVRLKGGLSGGTLASMMNMMEQGDLRRLADPVLLSPAAHRTREARAANPDVRSVAWDDVMGAWTAPFLMGAVNSRVVRRSAALSADAGAPWGSDFRYTEFVTAPTRGKARMFAMGLGAGQALLGTPVGRAIARKLGPSPGEGPDAAARESGFLRVRLVGLSEGGDRVEAVFEAQGDPGYHITITTACQAALTLALDGDALPGGPSRGGVLTPATALGAPYVQRLRDAGIRLEVV